LALDSGGQVWAWGYNGAGALGDGTTTNRLHAVKVQTPILPGEPGYPGNRDLTGVTQISAGGSGTSNFSLALTEDGGLYSWGANANGQLANGTLTGTNVATLVTSNGFNVLPTPPDATLAANVTQGVAPGAVTLSATVTDPDGPTNIQKVDFYDQGVLVGTRTMSPWELSLTNLAAGSHHAVAIVTDRQGNTGMSLPVDYVITP
jgi:alpha-tubulin suppressor-like RCC1 family protein